MRNPAKAAQPLALFCALLFPLVMSSAAMSADEGGFAYRESTDPEADVQQALERARQGNKRLLVVMGAQWCHDSTGLAATFSEPEMAAILEQSYETVFVDVGYFKDLRGITRRFNQPHYFATPTVMIIDPESERLLNASDMYIWGSADSLPLARYLEYFDRYAKHQDSDPWVAPAVRTARLDEFEQHNSERLMDAYEKLIPGMREENRAGRASSGFYTRWREVREFRMQLQRDIQALREQAAANPEAPLSLPVYAPFSWESSVQ